MDSSLEFTPAVAGLVDNFPDVTILRRIWFDAPAMDGGLQTRFRLLQPVHHGHRCRCFSIGGGRDAMFRDRVPQGGHVVQRDWQAAGLAPSAVSPAPEFRAALMADLSFGCVLLATKTHNTIEYRFESSPRGWDSKPEINFSDRLLGQIAIERTSSLRRKCPIGYGSQFA